MKKIQFTISKRNRERSDLIRSITRCTHQDILIAGIECTGVIWTPNYPCIEKIQVKICDKLYRKIKKSRLDIDHLYGYGLEAIENLLIEDIKNLGIKGIL